MGIHDTRKVVATGVEMFKEPFDEGRAGITLNSSPWYWAWGDWTWSGNCKTGTITPHTKFETEVYVLSKDEGGRHTPFLRDISHSSTSEQLTLRGSNSSWRGRVVMPGDNIKWMLFWGAPIAFLIRQSLLFVRGSNGGAGVVTKIIE